MTRTLLLLAAFSFPFSTACEQRRVDTAGPVPPVVDYAPLDTLLARIRARLETMHDVARVKWNKQAPIPDPEREHALLKEVSDRGQELGLEAEFTRAFFTAQIDAAKLVQEDDFRQWRASKQPPFADVPELPVLRKNLDALNAEFLALLVQVRPLLASPKGQQQLETRASAVLAGIPEPVRETALRPLHR